MEGSVAEDFTHVPVLVREVLAALAPRSGGIYVDCTAGGGGHSDAILAASSPAGTLLALDRDPDAVAAATARLAGWGTRATVAHERFSALPAVLARHAYGRPRGEGRVVDGVLFDVGVSSHQLDVAARGFSFGADGPLDMRMAQDGPTAAELIDSLDVAALAALLAEYGEVEQPRRYAAAIRRARESGALSTTRELAAVCEAVAGPRHMRRHHPATLVFQALRIAVNDELGELDALLAAIPDVLDDGGVAVAITFHSLEDRRVKRCFAALASPPPLPRGVPVRAAERVAPFVMVARGETAQPDELETNPRARTARVRAIRKLPVSWGNDARSSAPTA
jgi:16S rRNA (cytosine1402-N4)-methyltransferase